MILVSKDLVLTTINLSWHECPLSKMVMGATLLGPWSKDVCTGRQMDVGTYLRTVMYVKITKIFETDRLQISLRFGAQFMYLGTPLSKRHDNCYKH